MKVGFYTSTFDDRPFEEVADFAGTLSIEHEDAACRWPGKDLDARKEGERLGLAYLRDVLSTI